MVEFIRKRDGRVVKFEKEKITAAITKAFQATNTPNGKNASQLADQVVSALEERGFELPGVEDVQDLVEEVLIKNGFASAARAYILYRKRRAELREAKTFLGVRDELKLTLNAAIVLEKRYLLKDETGRVTETPGELFHRVARAIARGDPEPEIEKDFYQMMADLYFLPNSPTLMNAGTPLGQLSACFVLPIEDSLESIFDAVKHMALIQQSGGGTGFSFSRLRPRGDIVKSTHGVASGPVSFIHVFDTATSVIKQGGKRRGANMGILHVNHPDIIEFITSKTRENKLTNFNISVAVDDKFMEAVESDTHYELINPRTQETVKKIRAREIWDLIITMAWQTGDPGLVFIDEINRHNPTPALGKIESTNPCVTADTWIMTEDGPKQVSELIGREFVGIINGEKWKSNGGFFSRGVKPVYRLRTSEGFEVCLTADHPVKKVKRMTRYVIETEWTRAGELEPGDRVVINNHRNFKGWQGKYDENEGYLIGLLLGDGTIKRDKAVLSSWMEGGARAVRKTAYRCMNKLPHRSDFRGWMKVRGRNEYRMSTGYLRKLAAELGLRPGLKTITPEMEKTSSSFYKGFLRGLFDADGSPQGNQRKGTSVRLSQSNLEILKAVQRMLLRLGISSKIYKNRRDEGTRELPGHKKEYNIKPQHELVISNDNIVQFREKVGFSDTDKIEKLEEILNSYTRRPNRDRFIARVEELVPEGEEEVYDVRIPKINAFDANGFVVHNCGEQPLLPYESCNLGSVNLARMTRGGEIDWERLSRVVGLAVRFLDDTIEVNRFPLPEIASITRGNRKIGLGVMGFADTLIQLGIPYNSTDALRLAEKVMKFIQDRAAKASRELAETRGVFPNHPQSVFQEPRRNATLTTIAPTGTISIIAGCSSGIEPLFAISFVRNVLGGTKLLEVNPYFEETARKRGFHSQDMMMKIARTGSIQDLPEIPGDVKELFVTAPDIPPEWHVRMQATFQKYTDNAVSKTINFPQDAGKKQVEEAYLLAYKLKCKGITIYRYGSKKTQVLYTLSDEIQYMQADPEYSGGCPLPSCF